MCGVRAEVVPKRKLTLFQSFASEDEAMQESSAPFADIMEVFNSTLPPQTIALCLERAVSL